MTVGDLSELVHGQRLEKFAVINKTTTWFDQLGPRLTQLREQKKAALGLLVKLIFRFVIKPTSE